MGVNFWGVLYGIQAFVPHMLAHQEEGHVVNTASLAGLLPGGSAYSVSKHCGASAHRGAVSAVRAHRGQPERVGAVPGCGPDQSASSRAQSTEGSGGEG